MTNRHGTPTHTCRGRAPEVKKIHTCNIYIPIVLLNSTTIFSGGMTTNGVLYPQGHNRIQGWWCYGVFVRDRPSIEGFPSFYRAMHFSAKRGIAIACRLSVCLSVTLVDCDHIGRNTSEIISPLVSLGCSLSADPNIMGLLQGERPKFGHKVTHPLLI